MKETKVYVDDETLMKCERYRHNNCPIIQTHDRELVKEVCEKISIELENETETYEKDGQNKSSTRMVVDRVHFTYGKKNNDNQGQEQKQELTPVDDDNLPF